MKNRVIPILCLVVTASSAQSQGMFLPASDARLRADVSLLVDEGVFNLPVNEWPLAREDVAQAVASVKAEDLAEPALLAALHRVRAVVAPRTDDNEWKVREVRLTAGEPGLLRNENTLGRENGELMATGGTVNSRYGITLALTGVVDPSDGKEVRFDGSDISIRWGNWVLSANQMDRWWGPGHDGSLILSSNARPVPAVSLDRYRSVPWDIPVLRWLGPWRFSAFLGAMETERADVNRPAFGGMRLSFKPAPIFEFGLSRTAMFCGKGRDCDLGTLGRVLIGQDNVHRRGLNEADEEPGNQMAGFDVRIVSPFRSLPIAIYGQEIGEDNSSTGIPERYLGMFGGETWFLLDSGSTVRAHIEYANTKVKWYDSKVEYDWAYRQNIFFAGYRHYGRNIGHTTDADSETTSIQASVTRTDGSYWALQYRHGRLDRCCEVDSYNPITAGPSSYESMELTWQGAVLGQSIGAQLGYEKQSPGSAGRSDGVYGFIQWRKSL